MARTLRATPSALWITIRLLSRRTAPGARKRMQQSVIPTTTLTGPPAANPQRRYVNKRPERRSALGM